MTTIDSIGRPAVSPVARRRNIASGFALPPDPLSITNVPADSSSDSGNSAPVFTAFMEGLLGLQEQGPADAVAAPAVRDREARRHGQALLSALSELQWLMVGGSVEAPKDISALLERLAGLAASVPIAADPGLRGAVAAIGLRAQVELARRTR